MLNSVFLLPLFGLSPILSLTICAEIKRENIHSFIDFKSELLVL